ncbi:putative inorganic carbon transporter subunit DabA [Shewanella mangrovi]|uniref:putative inorganic carbon transporter subunit DabA n=1 Tax=Shewanella mangrovi TaxID=1515746 RepID=UPI00068C44F1|nr:putative inorganic carbon transporter subunit DabA [Shewanella mangrovi]
MMVQQLTLPYFDIAKQVAASIAPAFPLDQSVAVNPWWPQRHDSIEQTFAEQAVLTGETGLMSKNYFRQQWGQQIQSQHLVQAIAELGSPLSATQLEQDIQHGDSDVTVRWQTLAMLMDEAIPSEQGHSWAQEIVQQVSQFIALYHQYPERFDAEGKNGEHLYQSWLEVVARDKGIKTLLGVDLLALFRALPSDIEALFEQVGTHWQATWCDQAGAYAFMRASLHQLSGWAGWQAWLDWQATLSKQTLKVPHSLGLTAILLAWDTVLMQWLTQQHPKIAATIQQNIAQQTSHVEAYYQLAKQQLAPLWVWQRALELSVQSAWIDQVKAITPAAELARPELQAIFCIDVRSEPMRRALEAQSDKIETLGFAGFFGIPIAYQTHDGSILRPQLPGLLAPALVAKQTHKRPERILRLTKLGWQNSLEKPSSNLGMVEAGGLLKLVSLFKRVVLQQGTSNPVNKDMSSNAEWQLTREQQPLTITDKAELAAGIIKAMGIAKRLAKTVLLTGHGSQTCNNHTASGLDCGACGGQTGEVNVKVLASLLNDDEVRAAMPQFGVTVPADTQFYAAMHNTTTDALDVFDAATAPWREWLYAASQQARMNRSTQFDASHISAVDAQRFFNKRANSWAQMRPEWGLCNNAGVFIAPRSLTRNLDFNGRAFLHEYHVSEDPLFTQLEKIMTAPLLVMNWINLQYFASVTTPEKYGSGNKLLHNVVGGHIGVFEGNGGDLRIGLSTQSVHDGKQYRHQPVRLSAYIQAPKEAIATIINRHQDVASLVNNGWLFIYQLDEQQQVWQYQQGEWLAR